MGLRIFAELRRAEPMKKTLLLIGLSAVFAGTVYAQAPAPAAAPASAAPAKVNVICKDGSSFSGDTTKGACSGHGGIDKKASKAAAAKPAAAPAASSTPAATAKPASKTASAPAPGGGADKVWVNTSTKVYHCPGGKYYGKTKQGEYMTEADAKAKGFHADHGKACAK